ncbi:hypothetical protein BJ508DRAFT_323839 [Ascobolus immersus RN42]|uniref:Uncharacterized protein n=1 Tax=Ascobolus immersus RN42 TaxID=1160509 RepID=A0A3N4IFH1_ASCIM|nr:hypothetical protein BJ508DRAFT_323839 [Ascobolus immersus RN42]
MTTFFTLPFELHHHIAAFLLPPFPQYVRAWRTSDRYRRKHHDYIGPGSLGGILSLIIALGPDVDEREPQDSIFRYLRQIYTTDVCMLLKKTVTTQAILAKRQVDYLQRDGYQYLIWASLLEVHNAFDTVWDLGHPYGRSNLEFEFWCIFFQVWDNVRYAVPPVMYQKCCLRRLCTLPIGEDLEFDIHLLRANEDLFHVALLETASGTKSEIEFEERLTHLHHEDGYEEYGPQNGTYEQPVRLLRDRLGAWEIGWEKQELPDTLEVSLEVSLEKLIFCQYMRSGSRFRVYARPGLIAAFLRRKLVKNGAETLGVKGTEYSPVDVGAEYDVYIANHYRGEENGNFSFGWKGYVAEHARVKDIVVKLVSNALDALK